MKLHLTRSEMLTRWRQVHGLDPLRDDAVVSRTDGLDFDAMLLPAMEAWYHRLLREAPAHLLAPENVALDRLIISEDAAGGCSVVRLPVATVRVLAVTSDSWSASARIVAADTPEARRQLHPYTRATRSAPVAVLDLKAGTLRLYPALGSSRLTRLDAVLHHPDSYDLDEAALDRKS